MYWVRSNAKEHKHDMGGNGNSTAQSELLKIDDQQPCGTTVHRRGS